MLRTKIDRETIVPFDITFQNAVFIWIHKNIQAGLQKIREIARGGNISVKVNFPFFRSQYIEATLECPIMLQRTFHDALFVAVKWAYIKFFYMKP